MSEPIPMTRPSLLDKSFRYTRAVETDIRKTFARERRRLAEQAARPVEARNVRAMPQRKGVKA